MPADLPEPAKPAAGVLDASKKPAGDAPPLPASKPINPGNAPNAEVLTPAPKLPRSSNQEQNEAAAKEILDAEKRKEKEAQEKAAQKGSKYGVAGHGEMVETMFQKSEDKLKEKIKSGTQALATSTMKSGAEYLKKAQDNPTVQKAAEKLAAVFEKLDKAAGPVLDTVKNLAGKFKP